MSYDFQDVKVKNDEQDMVDEEMVNDPQFSDSPFNAVNISFNSVNLIKYQPM